MAKSKKVCYKCKACDWSFDLTRENVVKDWVRRGYDGDYEGLFIKCPKCGNQKQQIFFSQLPFRIKLSLIREKLGI